MIHWPDPRVDIRYPLEVLAKLKTQGKIHRIGLSNPTLGDLEKADQVERIRDFQGECNLFNNSISAFEKEGHTLMGWGVYDKGILSGRVSLDRKFEKGDARSWAPWWKKSAWKQKVKKLKGIDPNFIRRAALSYAAAHCDHPIVGWKSIEQIESTLWDLNDPPTFSEIEKLKNEISLD
jgi:aryl-alcohol dehydrogenase-like predicted oxidoreductase